MFKMDGYADLITQSPPPTLVHTYPHTQNGNTALIIACDSKSTSLALVNNLLKASPDVDAQSTQVGTHG